VHVTVGVALPRWLCRGPEWMDHTLIAPHTKFQMQRNCSYRDTSETDPPQTLNPQPSPAGPKSSVAGGVHVTVGVALPRWLRCGREWMDHTLIALHTKFQMQRRCSGGDRSVTEPTRPLLRA